jgi:hypothetical protein
MTINLAQFDAIRPGDVVTYNHKEVFIVTDVAATFDNGKRTVNTIIFDDGTCITRQDGYWLLRANVAFVRQEE